VQALGPLRTIQVVVLPQITTLGGRVVKMKPTIRRVAPDSRILKMREYEDRHRILTEAKLAQQQVLAAAEWEKNTDTKIKAKVIQGRFQHLKNNEEHKLEARREKLAEMLRTEELQLQEVGLSSSRQ
jgi:hypothetical protein